MARHMKVDALPSEVREWLEKVLADRAHAGYKALAELLKAQGYDISHTAVWRYDKNRIQRTMAKMQATAEVARIVTQANPDDADEHTAAVIRLVQSSLFEAMIRVREAEDADPAEQVKLLSQAAQAVAQVGRASLAQKRWQDEVRAKLDALEADNKDKRLDAETLQRVREALYGG